MRIQSTRATWEGKSADPHISAIEILVWAFNHPNWRLKWNAWRSLKEFFSKHHWYLFLWFRRTTQTLLLKKLSGQEKEQERLFGARKWTSAGLQCCFNFSIKLMASRLFISDSSSEAHLLSCAKYCTTPLLCLLCCSLHLFRPSKTPSALDESYMVCDLFCSMDELRSMCVKQRLFALTAFKYNAEFLLPHALAFMRAVFLV